MTMTPNSDDARPYFNTAEAAKYLRLSPRTLENMRLTGEGPVYRKHGRLVVYHLTDLIAWSESRKQESTSDVS